MAYPSARRGLGMPGITSRAWFANIYVTNARELSNLPASDRPVSGKRCPTCGAYPPSSSLASSASDEASAGSSASVEARHLQQAEGIDRSSCSVQITPKMLEAGVKILRESGKLYYESSSDDLLVREIIETVLLLGNDL
jgi:hypothetical protein